MKPVMIANVKTIDGSIPINTATRLAINANNIILFGNDKQFTPISVTYY